MKVQNSAMKVEDSVSYVFSSVKDKNAEFLNGDFPSKETFFTEVEAIDMTLKIVHLLELIHEKDLIFTNLCPEEIFLKNRDVN